MPSIVKVHWSSGVCGVGPAERTGKPPTRCWPGGIRLASPLGSRRRNPRVIGLTRGILAQPVCHPDPGEARGSHGPRGGPRARRLRLERGGRRARAGRVGDPAPTATPPRPRPRGAVRRGVRLVRLGLRQPALRDRAARRHPPRVRRRAGRPHPRRARRAQARRAVPRHLFQVTAGREQGLLSMAFAPDYATSGRFYVYYTDPGRPARRRVRRASERPGGRGLGAAVLRSTTRAQPQRRPAALRPRRPALRRPRRRRRRRRPARGARQRAGPRDAARQDPAHRPAPGRRPAVPRPVRNPFVGRQGARGEIYSYGLRNPWRFSFDRRTGDLSIGDVGQDARRRSTSCAATAARARTSAGGCSRAGPLRPGRERARRYRP